MGVVVLVPVLARPHRVAPLLESFAAATPEPHRVLFVVDEGDQAELAAVESAGADHLVVPRGQRSYARKINAGYRATTELLLFLAADDVLPHPGWLTAALAVLTDAVGVVGTNDLGNSRVIAGQHSTHSLVTRAYADRHGTADGPGAILHDGYRHNFCDDELVATAEARGAWAFAADSVVEHLHPHWGKGTPDATYDQGRASFRTDQRLFRQRCRLWAA